MFCPVCGATELVHGVHPIPYTWKGRTTSFQLEGDKCPVCGEIILAKPECDRLDALMEAVERSVNGTKPAPRAPYRRSGSYRPGGPACRSGEAGIQVRKG